MRPMGVVDRIDTLGVISVYYIMCDAPIEAKVGFVDQHPRPIYSPYLCTQLNAVFNLFDFNANKQISKDELVCLVVLECMHLRPETLNHMIKINK